jgi:hypothetical protein
MLIVAPQVIHDFLFVHFADTGSSTRNFLMSTNFPKTDLKDMSLTIESASLFPRGALFVTDLDA